MSRDETRVRMGTVRESLVLDPLYIPDDAEVLVTKTLSAGVLTETIDALVPAAVQEINVKVRFV